MKSLFAVPAYAILLFVCSTAFGQSLARAPDLDASRGRPGSAAPARADVAVRGASLRETLRNGPVSEPATPHLELSGECGRRRGGPDVGLPGTRPPAGRHIRVVRHDVKVSIVDGVAITEIDQTFHNDAATAVEGTYVCPLPESAVVHGFSIYERGREIQGVVVGREEGRRIYDEITRRRRDPGIVEVVSRGIRTRIFPIPARGDMRVRTRFARILERRNGLYGTSVPLEGLPGGRIKSASFSIDARSSWPLALRFPREFDFQGRSSADSTLWDLSFAAEDFAPRRNLEIRCLSHQPNPGLALHVHRTKSGERYFMAVLAAGDRSLHGVELSLEGVKTADVYPKSIRGLPAKRLTHVFGRLVGPGVPKGVLRARRGGEPLEVRTGPVSAGIDTGFVAGMWADAHVRAILDGRGGSRSRTAAATEALELSKRHGILIESTAILAR